jgi:hypothetical protein
VGLESRAKAKLGARRVLQDGTLFLEGQEIFFRPDVPEGQRVKRLRIPVAETTRLEAAGKELVIEHKGELMRFAIDHPERWVAKIRTPKSRVDKLGIRAGTVVHVVNVDDPALDDELSATLAVKKKALSPEVDVVLLGARTASDLSPLSKVVAGTKETVALWVLWTKQAALAAAANAPKKGARGGKAPPKPAEALKEDDIRRIAGEAGLVDVKVVSFSDELSALKLMVRKKDRRLALLSSLTPLKGLARGRR